MMHCKLKILPSGWLYFSIGPMWAQMPPGFSEEVIPDAYIFEADWCREKINRAWRGYLKGEDDANA